MKNFLWHLVCGGLLCLSGLCLATEVAAQIPDGPCPPSKTLQVSIDASPDLDSSRPGIQVKAGTRVQLSGTSRTVSVKADCTETEGLAVLSWALTLQPEGGEEADITSSLGSQTTQTLVSPSTTSFIASAGGIYRAKVRGISPGLLATTRLAEITVKPAFIQSCGQITFLRVNDIGGRFGPPDDFIDVEVVTKIDTQPDRGMGFQLRNDGNEPVRRAMLDLLRDALSRKSSVCLEYFLQPGKKNGILNRVVFEN